MPPVAYSDFLQRVRRHRPSDLLPALAVTAVEFFEPDAWNTDRVRLPWALAGAAKASIVSGNEYRNRGVSDRDVFDICKAYNALGTPLTRHGDNVSETVGAFLVRLGYEQFTYQQSHSEEVGRLGAMFDHLEAINTEILNNALIEQILGCSLQEFVSAGLVIAIGARSNAGFFNPEWPSLWEGPGAVHTHFSMEIVRQVFVEHFLATFDDIRKVAKNCQQSDPRLRHYEFNPLVSRPFVTLPDGRHLAPQPHFVFQRLSPSVLYYAGLKALGDKDAKAFTRDVGVVFQEYIGRQLRLMPGATVLPEITYGGAQRSVDWFVIFDELVVLVEVKSTRLSHLARMGGNKLQDDFKRSVGKGYSQVTKTDELLTEGHEAFRDIPRDRPRMAIVATLEPYWAANSAFLKTLHTEPPIATIVASARAIEQLVDVVSQIGTPRPLIDIANDDERHTWNLETALPNISTPENPILANAWNRYPFH